MKQFVIMKDKSKQSLDNKTEGLNEWEFDWLGI